MSRNFCAIFKNEKYGKYVINSAYISLTVTIKRDFQEILTGVCYNNSNSNVIILKGDYICLKALNLLTN